MLLFVESACFEQDIVFTMSLGCMCLHASVCLDLSTPQLLSLWTDFKTIWHNCSPLCVDVPFEGFIRVGQRVSITQAQQVVYGQTSILVPHRIFTENHATTAEHQHRHVCAPIVKVMMRLQMSLLMKSSPNNSKHG